MIGAIIGAATSVAGGILGGIQSSNARKRASRVLDQRENRANAQYNRDYNQDYTQTTSAQNAIRRGREIMNDQINKVEGQKAVMGGTDASVANAKAIANETMGNVTAQIASEGENRAENAKRVYQSQMDAIDNARYQNEMTSAQQSALAGGQVMQAGMNLATTDIKASTLNKNGKGFVEDMFGLGKKDKDKEEEE